jgi:sterol 3beta-glucosyltransferase
LPSSDRESRILNWAIMHAHWNQLIAVEGVQWWLRSIAGDVAKSLVRHVQSSDAIISGVLTLDSALALRSALGCRVALAIFAPCLPTREGPSLIEAPVPKGSSFVNWWAGVATWLAGVRWSYPTGKIVREMQGLRQRPLRQMMPALLDVPVLLAASAVLVPKAVDWPSSVRLTGPWMNDIQPCRALSDDLQEFLDLGPEPLFVGFGSVGHRSDGRLFIDASRKAGVRIVASFPGGSGSEVGLIDRNVYCMEEVQHNLLFQRVAGVIHHGSAGTTAAALQAGIPSAAIPHEFDQRYYACRLSLLGVGPKAVPRRRLNRDLLADIMQEMTTGSAAMDYRARAQRIGTSVARERGTSEAISFMREEGVF